MKVSKPKENQLLFEDDCLRELKLKVETKGGLNDSEFNDIYEAIIIGYRTTNMDASKQMFVGDKISLMTLFSAMLENMFTYKIITERELQEQIKLILKEMKRKGNL